MGSLFPTIRNLIEINGPMSISTYMSTLLTFKSSGYYMRKDVFGRSGDFITAPEISQLFGEMIAIHFLSKFECEIGIGSRPFHLIEFGPGRGTLMNDVLRAFSCFPDFFKKIEKCSFIEMSPYLKEIQYENMKNWRDKIEFDWFDHIGGITVQSNSTPIVIAQEFFDALPIHVFKKTNGSWKELKVALQMCLIEQSSRLAEILKLSSNFPNFPNDQTLELSPSSWAICQQIKNIFDRCERGEGIFIDYGNFIPSKNSLRAIYKHEFCSIFDHMGDADLSADVDFQSLMHYLGSENKYKFLTQGDFLESMGIKQRAKMLASNLEEVDKAVERLTNKDEMGKIYKVLQFSRK